MVGFVNDAGVPELGHRRWIIDPEAMEMGSGSTGGSNALVVLSNGGDGSRAAAVPADRIVGWPSSGWFPTPWIFEDWSIAIGNGTSQGNVSVANAQVSVKVDGDPAGVSMVRQADGGYGTGVTLTWWVQLPQSIVSGDHEIRVDVSGVTMNNAPMPVSYTVKAFDPTKAGPGPGGGGDDACEKAKKKLKKATAKLKKAKKSGKPAKIKKAKKKVKKAKAKKKDAC